MRIFLADIDVARALVPDAGWQACKAVILNGGVAGFFADLDQQGIDTVQLYFEMFSGQWRELDSDQGQMQGYCGDDGMPIRTREGEADIERLVAKDVAVIARQKTGANIPLNRAALVMRARSAVRAGRQRKPVLQRKAHSVPQTVISGRSLPYAKYFDVEDLTVQHARFDGKMSDNIVRSVLRSADAVTALPYDPVLDCVVLVEQFRPGAFVRGDPHPWVLEPVAGRCDGDEPVEVVAEREMVEEAGLCLQRLEPIGNYYPSPGCLSEYLYSFVGLVDLSAFKEGLHGLATENEDIRTHLLSFDAAMGLIETGEADNGPLLLSLYWLSANRARLREQGARK